MAKTPIEVYNEGLSPEERSRRARLAGAASGEARAKHRLFKDILKDILALPIDNEDVAFEQLEKLGIKANHENAMMLAAAKKAMLGDVEAARFVRDTVGEKPTEAFNLAVHNGPIKALDMAGLSDQELEALADQEDEETAE